MFKILLRLFVAIIIFASSYIIYKNTTFSSFENFKSKREIFVRFQNFPEMFLPSKENYTGYQYELLTEYVSTLDINSLKIQNNSFDIDVYYTSDICDTCIIINTEDLVLVSDKRDIKSKDIEIIESLNKINLNHPVLKKYDITITDNSIDELITNLNNNLVSYTLLSRSTYLFYKKYFPNLEIKSNTVKVSLVWDIPNDDGTIRDNINGFLKLKTTKNFISNLKKKYYSKNNISSYIFIGSRIFISDMITKLPNYESLFKQASDKYGLDWKLLAAISYQESKWDNDAVSPTGVRGLMMLTKSTAKMLNVNRLKPSESVLGGAKYFNALKNKYSNFNDSTKINLALASYNAGPNHINDIIELAKQNNEDIQDWSILKTYLYKLNQKRYYKKMKYGYARGWEAVQYIENVKQYYDIISFLETKDENNSDRIFNEVPSTL